MSRHSWSHPVCGCNHKKEDTPTLTLSLKEFFATYDPRIAAYEARRKEATDRLTPFVEAFVAFNNETRRLGLKATEEKLLEYEKERTAWIEKELAAWSSGWRWWRRRPAALARRESELSSYSVIWLALHKNLIAPNLKSSEKHRLSKLGVDDHLLYAAPSWGIQSKRAIEREEKFGALDALLYKYLTHYGEEPMLSFSDDKWVKFILFHAQLKKEDLEGTSESTLSFPVDYLDLPPVDTLWSDVFESLSLPQPTV